LRLAIPLFFTFNPLERAELPWGLLYLRLYRAQTGADAENPGQNPGGGRKLNARSSIVEGTAPPRYLGLDIGSRRIGVAVSDELGLTAQPVLTLERRSRLREDLRSLARLCRRFGVAGIVVGNPMHLSGEPSPQAAKTRAFAAALGELTGLPIHLWDERLTTREAHKILYEAGHERQKHRKVVDQVAATLILQSFLDGRSNS
jgi:putative Holliday junction resolvase